MQIIDYGDYYKPNKPQPKPKAQYYEPPKPKPAAKKVLAQPVKPQMPPPTLPGQYPQPPKTNIPDSDYYGWDDLWGDIGNWLQNIGTGGAPYQPPTMEYYQQLSGEKPVYRNTLPQGNTLGAPDSYMTAAAAGQEPFRPNYSYYYPMSGAPANWQIAPIRGASRSDQPYNPQQAYYGYSPERDPTMEDDIAWQNSRRRTGNAIRPQDYFMRTLLNGIGYSLPNQMLNFTDTGGVSADWEQTPRWYEPPAGYTTSGAGWKESIGKPWGLQDVTDGGTFEPYGEGGGYGGWGSGGGGAYGASSGVNSYLPGTRAGYGANASSPRYTGGTGGRGSSYAGAQSMSQAAWRMPMLVWNI